MERKEKDGGISMRMKEMVKKMAVIAITAAVVFGSVQSGSITTEAKGTAFINKKASSVTPTVKSAKRSNEKVNVTVSVPTSKVKKLGNVKKITVAYGSTKNSKKFEALKAKVKVTKKGKNQYTFTINNKKLNSYKNAYLTVRFDGKSNWSKLVKVTGKATKPNYKMPKRDKDGTYTKSILKRFDQGLSQGTKAFGDTLGAFDDGDGWVYVNVQYTRCAKCGHTAFDFLKSNDDARDFTVCESCQTSANKWNCIASISFDTKTGKVVSGSDFVLAKYPIGTFFMEVE